MECSVNPLKVLSVEEKRKLEKQDSRGLVTEFQQLKLEKEAAKNWDLFYKRNEDRFFKDRHWTTREFVELVKTRTQTPTLLEVGCGVGNFFYPLLEDGLKFKIHACDFSPRAIDLVKKNALFDPQIINAFVCDLTKDDLNICANSIDLVSLVFVLSAILPRHMKTVVEKLYASLRPGGFLLFRDYALHDMAMLRFGPGSKLGDRLYVRQDGTRSFYFTVEEVERIFTDSGFEVVFNQYIERKTVNRKEGVDAKRIFVQAKCRKPEAQD
ncbi:UNVERIFIED_CONTAM: hypothetical protein GTU68_042952 [Idotea baltica]|nr:hypothetical protein [Idotea baltica]